MGWDEMCLLTGLWGQGRVGLSLFVGPHLVEDGVGPVSVEESHIWSGMDGG